MICWQAANKEDELERKLNAYRGFDPEDGPGYSMQIKEEQHLLEPDKVAAIKHALAEAEYWNYVACRAQHITVAWQYSIVWVFWLFVGPVFFTTNMLWNFGLVFAHIVPAILVIIHFHLGKSRIRLRDFLISFLITSVYVFVNFAFCKVTGVPVYPFMTWTSSICLLYSLGCWLIGQVCMGFSTLFQEWRHGRSYNKCI